LQFPNNPFYGGNGEMKWTNGRVDRILNIPDLKSQEALNLCQILSAARFYDKKFIFRDRGSPGIFCIGQAAA
jgi:hypothetical protein